ncbi:phage SPO1 DNA polymerase-related protein [Caballeronia terrestris]|uniref:Type-4 uracil-DNA glycosylase n=1 Tax=Caballeronia terrestris TaxID=1226301 RepID=A0A158EVP5_9BURK|nr:phage SPO1 DNA polymerase-related protein [Caballeronia terrestris]
MAATQQPGFDLDQEPASLDECRRCPLWKDATQAVPGAGPRHAPLMIVGEQPGDQEDLQGKPFVGPAGAMLDRALEEAGVERKEVYVTNAVKHFKWEPRGKRRMHKSPARREVDACHYWLDIESGKIEPKVIVALGATALKAVLQGSGAKLQASMGHAIAQGSRVPAYCAR